MEGKRKRLSADERRRQILKATFDLVSDKGFKSVSTRTIAEKAGINEALIFKYFGTKRDLLAGIVELVKELRPSVSGGLPEDEADFFGALKRFENFFLSLNCADPATLKVILYAVLEEYPVPIEFDMSSEGTFLNWLLLSIRKGKAHWGFDEDVNEVEAICLFMGALVYFVLETSVLGLVDRPNGGSRFTELLFKALK